MKYAISLSFLFFSISGCGLLDAGNEATQFNIADDPMKNQHSIKIVNT